MQQVDIFFRIKFQIIVVAKIKAANSLKASSFQLHCLQVVLKNG